MSEFIPWKVFGELNKEIRKERHRQLQIKNMGILFDNNAAYTIKNNGETFLFRQPGKPKADFFPSTGRWRSKNKTYSGGARKFLAWYSKQVEVAE